MKSLIDPRRMRWWVLFVLTGINLLNYIDRYIFSALLPAIKADLGFTDTELGLLGSAFILAYLFISPVFGFFGDRGSRSRLMAAGVALWSGATAFSGIATSFLGQFVTRVAVGVGESAYSVIAPSSIADYFSRSSRGKIFAIYSGAIPVGSALGYVLGGFLEPRVGWQKSFFVVGIPGIMLAALLFFLRDPKRGQQDVGADEDEIRCGDPLKLVYKSLFTNGGFLSTVLGYAAYTFVVGGMAFWMPTYIVRYFDVSLEKGNLVFGGITVAGGFIGTLLGGWLADRIEKRSGNGYLKVAVASMIVAVPLFWLTLQMREFSFFAGVLFVMEIALFLCISPLDAAVLNFVRPQYRSTAMALNIFLIHLLGDGISRVLMGAVSDASDLRTAIGYLPWVLALAGLIWMVGVVLYWLPLQWPQGGLSLPKRQAHRGFRPQASIQENTLEAFRLARQQNAPMIECDVHLAGDGEVVVFHDSDLSRLAGSPDRVDTLSAEELKRRANAPTLREVLTDSGVPSLVNIELKWSQVSGGALERAVVEVVRETRSEGRIVFSSFNPFVLRRLAKLAPEVPRALLVTERASKGNSIYLRKAWLAFHARPHLLHLDDPMITPLRMERWRERGIPIVAWTVNDARRAEELVAMGVQSIISDMLMSEEDSLPRETAAGTALS